MKTILVDAVNTFVVEAENTFAIFEEMHTLLESYPNKKIVLTNANDEQMQTFNLTNLPYELFSMKHSPDKVDPMYFKTMLTHYNLTPDKVVYFEHNPEAVKSAQSVGITSYHYDHQKKDLSVLKQFLDANL